MYRGAVVEAGSVEEVIRNPKHPYTQLLVESIPQMRAVRDWEREEEEGEGIATLDESSPSKCRPAADSRTAARR